MLFHNEIRYYFRKGSNKYGSYTKNDAQNSGERELDFYPVRIFHNLDKGTKNYYTKENLFPH